MMNQAIETVAAHPRSYPVLIAQTFNSFRYPVYRIFFAGMLPYRAAMNMQSLVRSLLVYRLTGSATILGAMAFAHSIPLLLLSLSGGTIADRFQKKYILLIGNVLSMLTSAAVAMALLSGYLDATHGTSLWVLVAASILHGSVMGFYRPSQQAILPEIVGKEHLMNAVSLNSMSMNAMRFLAPAAAGLLTDAIGFEAVYFTMTGLYGLSALILLFMPLTVKISKPEYKALDDIKEGLRYVWRNTTILFILGFALFGVVLSLPYMMMLPVFADDILKVGASGQGLLMSASGIGAIIGALLLASLPNKNRGFLLLLSSTLLGAALASFSFSKNWPLSLIMIGFVGCMHSSRMTLSNTILQYYTQPEYRGRVMSIYMMEIGLMSLGAFIAGLLADAVGVSWALGSMAILLMLVSFSALLFSKRIRTLR